MKKIILILFVLLLLVTVYLVKETNIKEEGIEKNNNVTEEIIEHMDENVKSIYLAGGCFWGVEGYFSRLEGVVNAVSGYANGDSDETNYQKISYTNHAETVKVDYDISIISLEEILLHYFKIIDPKSINKQGNDIGTQYRTGVYYLDEVQKEIIEKVFTYQESKIGDIAVECEELKNFVLAEDYHQDYLEKNPNGYCHINLGMASEPIFDEVHKNPDEEIIKKNLDELSYGVLRNNQTEAPFSSDLNSEYKKGIYVDKITKEPLFASKDKFDSGCGWPSFSKPILTDKINYLKDNSHSMTRIEVRSKGGDNHLGHVFDDGPKDKGGLRYCINGAALEFIPYEEMDERGYGEYKIFCE